MQSQTGAADLSGEAEAAGSGGRSADAQPFVDYVGIAARQCSTGAGDFLDGSRDAGSCGRSAIARPFMGLCGHLNASARPCGERLNEEKHMHSEVLRCSVDA